MVDRRDCCWSSREAVEKGYTLCLSRANQPEKQPTHAPQQHVVLRRQGLRKYSSHGDGSLSVLGDACDLFIFGWQRGFVVRVTIRADRSPGSVRISGR